MHAVQGSGEALELRAGIRGADRDVPVGGRVLILKRIRPLGALLGHHESAAWLHWPGANRVGLLHGGPLSRHQRRFRGNFQLTEPLGMLVLERQLLNVVIYNLQPRRRSFPPVRRGHPDGDHPQGHVGGNGPSRERIGVGPVPENVGPDLKVFSSGGRGGSLLFELFHAGPQFR